MSARKPWTAAEFADIGSHRLAVNLKLIGELTTHQQGTHFDLASPGSELAEDDARLGYLQLSHLVGHCLSFSLDQLMSVRMLLTSPEKENGIRLPMVSQYSMIRASLEAASMAGWLLLPDDRAERLERALRVRWDDLVQDGRAIMTLTEIAPTDPKDVISRKNRQRKKYVLETRPKKRAYRDIAKAAGVTDDAMRTPPPGFGEMAGATAEAFGVAAAHANGTWRLISGMTHPSASRSLAMSSYELFDDREDGVSKALVTARPELVNMALEGAILAHWNALERTAQRGANPAVRFAASEQHKNLQRQVAVDL
jgi:hypothetical protein